MAKVYIPKNKITRMETLYFPDGGRTGREVQKLHPDAHCIYNAGLYNMANHEEVTRMKVNDKMIGYKGAWEGYGVYHSNNIGIQILWMTYEEAKLDDNIKSWIAGSPVLVKDGQIDMSWGDLYSPYLHGKRDRCVMCDNGTHLMILSISDLVTPYSEAVRVKRYMYAINAINLDGGGSTEIWRNGVRLCGSNRSNATWIVVYT